MPQFVLFSLKYSWDLAGVSLTDTFLAGHGYGGIDQKWKEAYLCSFDGDDARCSGKHRLAASATIFSLI